MMSKRAACLVRLFMVLSLCLSSLWAEPLQVLSGGESADGLNLAAIRIGKHPTYTRIVFDVTYWAAYEKEKAGKPADRVGHYRFVLQPDHSIEVELAGFRSTTASIPQLPRGSIITSIRRLSGEAYGDDSSVFYRIGLKRAAKMKAFYLKEPARIVLDIGGVK